MTTTTFAITKAMAAACKAYGNSVGMVGEKLEKLRAEFGPRMLERWTTLTTQESVPAKTASDQVCREVRQALTDQFGSQQNADTQRFMERQRALVDNIMTAERSLAETATYSSASKLKTETLARFPLVKHFRLELSLIHI